MYSEVSLYFESNDQSLSYLIDFKIRIIANNYNGIHIASKSDFSPIYIMYFSIPSNTLNCFIKELDAPFEIKTSNSKIYKYVNVKKINNKNLEELSTQEFI